MKSFVTRFRLPFFLLTFAMVSGVLFAGEALARHGGAHRYTGGVITFKVAITNPLATSRTDQTWATIPAGSAAVAIGPGRTALINARFFAESRCTGQAGSWCSVRILMFGIPAEPNQADGSDYAFDSAAADFWEGHAMERHFCIRNASTTETRVVPVVVQWRSAGPGVATFRLDETSLTVERSDGCSPVELTVQ
jgi:hypothetical protein